jgi:PAS domain S-box-containing protein
MAAVTRSSGHQAVGVEQPTEGEPHLRAVLETQPVILIRLAKDTKFLAVNESGLSALGADRLDQLLGTPLSALVPPEERAGLQAFIERVISGHRGSLEVDLIGLTGTRHTLQIHAAPHPGSPDQIESVLASLRDVTESRHLEQSLVEAMSRQTEQDAAHEAERSRLQSELEEARASNAGGQASEAELALLEARLAEAERLRTELTYRHAAEVEGLTEALDERTHISEEQAARLAELAELERRHTEDLAALSGQHKALAAELETLSGEYDAAKAEFATLSDQHDGAQAELATLADQHKTAQTDLAALSEQHNAAQAELATVAGRYRAAEADMAALRGEIEQTRTAAASLGAERDRFQAETETLRAALEQAREEGDRARHEVVGRLEADIAALKDALNEAMSEQARLAETVSAREEAANAAFARAGELELSLAELQQSTAGTLAELQGRLTVAREEAESLAQARDAAETRLSGRVAALEAALAAAQAAERRTASRLGALARNAGKVASQMLDLAATAAEGNGVSAGELASRVERPLGDVLGSAISLAVLVAAPDTVLAAPPEIVEQALLALAVNRGASMRSGQVTVELAEVAVDEDAARGRGSMTPGQYVLVAMHLGGDGASSELPADLFESTDVQAWDQAGAGLPAAFEAVRSIGGFMWLAREGADGVVFELYLPRESDQAVGEAR